MLTNALDPSLIVLGGGLGLEPMFRERVEEACRALIAYPRYWDPVSRRPCPVEVALDRLASGEIPHPGRANRLLSKLQGRFASLAHLWR